jgi:hypothetical protein
MHICDSDLTPLVFVAISHGRRRATEHVQYTFLQKQYQSNNKYHTDKQEKKTNETSLFAMIVREVEAPPIISAPDIIRCDNHRRVLVRTQMSEYGVPANFRLEHLNTRVRANDPRVGTVQRHAVVHKVHVQLAGDGGGGHHVHAVHRKRSAASREVRECEPHDFGR